MTRSRHKQKKESRKKEDDRQKYIKRRRNIESRKKLERELDKIKRSQEEKQVPIRKVRNED